MTAHESAYAASFLENSLGLVTGSLKPDDPPLGLVEELAAVMRGVLPGDSTAPHIETHIMEFLSSLQASTIESRGLFVRKARWPNAAPVAVCLTHDVDNIEHPIDHILKTQERFSKADLNKAKRGLLNLYDNVELIGRKEATEGFRSSFYIMSGNYPLDKVKAGAWRLHDKGWEMGLHGDFGTHDSDLEMAKAVRRLTDGIGIRPTGVREHYLKFDYGKSWGVMDRAGFDYDTTVGNADKLGFKMGLATPFHPPDDGWKPMRLLELPLSLMDTTLWGYLKKTEKEGHRDVLAAIESVRRVEGLFTLLWHQEAVRMRGGRLYWRILKDLSRMQGAFVGSGASVAKWWRDREVPLKSSPDGKVITLGGRPPKGLTLVVKKRPNAKFRVSGGTATKKREQTLVTPTGADFRLEVLT